ncbi:hypothetical protein [Arthrobacter zhaoguopingii]|uniref:hypothetical protein n=1 Tax=Arthrobacter zhaoguopingii TaxID=2681491 RepID=UPI00135682AB|nr:hypothetical protein [Arthrobacter zhaoguopingii]
MPRLVLLPFTLAAVLATSACMPHAGINFDGEAVSCPEEPASRECEDGVYRAADQLLSDDIGDEEFQDRALGVIRAVIVPTDLERDKDGEANESDL